MTDAIEVLHYQTADGRIPFREWLDTVTDPVAYAAIQLRQDRWRGVYSGIASRSAKVSGN